MKRITLVASTMLVTAVLTAQQSFGLQNHPAPRQLKEALDFQLLWDSRFQNIILILIVGILLTWGVYLFTVYKMFQDKKVAGDAYTSSNVSPTSPEYDFTRATESLRGLLRTPAVSLVDHTITSPVEGRDQADDDSPIRGADD